MLVTLTLTVMLAAKTVAVVDLSSPKSPAVAEAFRKLPSLKAVAMPAKATAAAVSDAESLGLICTVDDGPCLEKLMVLLRADELVAFSTGSSSVAVAHLTGNGKARHAKVKTAFSPAATAQSAWAALDDGGAPPSAGSPATGPAGTGPASTTPTSTTTTSTATTTGPASTTPASTTGPAPPGPVGPDGKELKPGDDTAMGNGVSPALAVAIAGGAIGVACGAATIGLFADLTRQADLANEGKAALPESFYAASDVTVALAVCTAAATGAAVVGTIFVATEP